MSHSLKIVDDGISTATIVGTSCGILVLLFLIQPFGNSHSCNMRGYLSVDKLRHFQDR